MLGKESIFAKTIINQRYAHTKLDGTLEDWKEISHRVVKHVLNAVDLSKDTKNEIENIIYKKQFIPAGRYLFATGYEYHQTNNCLSLRAEDSREGWGDLLQKAGLALMTGAGVGINYSALREEGAILKRIGGFSSGPISLMEMINEVGRQVKQGGTRRAANMAILSWKHPDIYKFIEIKNWSDFIKEAKAKDFNFPAPMDGTNISIQLDDEFFKAFHNINHKLYSHATSVYWATIEHMLKAGEPGFTIDTNDNAKEDLRNAPICGNTQVLLHTGYTKVKNIINKPVTIWTGVRWANDVIFRKTKSNADIVKVSLSNGKYICCEKEHPFLIEHEYASDILRISANKLEVNDICYVMFPDYNDTTINNVCVTNVEHLQEKEDVYCCNVGYEEHSFMAEGILISNCGEMTSEDDSEICNLASINLARIDSLEEMEKVVELGTIFLLAGSIYGDVPYDKVKIIRDKNRKIGLGILGLHEWLLMQNKKYDIDEDLAKYMKIYAKATEIAHKWCNKFNINKSIKTRAIAPSGTISLIAETSSGIEPILCSAYKRRYRKGADLIEYQYVLDPTAKKLADKGINVESIEDAYTLSEDVERRIKMQAWLQTEYVDQGISSTINLPAFGTPQNNHDTIIPFGNMLMQYLPKLRGITVYPANSRGAQPITPVSWKTAEKHVGQVFVEGGDICSIKGGSCNS